MVGGYWCYIFPTYFGVLVISDFLSFLSSAFHIASLQRKKGVSIIFFLLFGCEHRGKACSAAFFSFLLDFTIPSFYFLIIRVREARGCRGRATLSPIWLFWFRRSLWQCSRRRNSTLKPNDTTTTCGLLKRYLSLFHKILERSYRLHHLQERKKRITCFLQKRSYVEG